jgi:hypothetical protein
MDGYTFMWILIAAVLIVCAVLAWQDRNSPLGQLRRIRARITDTARILDGIEAEMSGPDLSSEEYAHYTDMHADAMETLRRLEILEHTMEQYVDERRAGA